MKPLALLAALLLPSCAALHGYPPDTIDFHYRCSPLYWAAKLHPYQPGNLTVTRRTDAQVAEFYQRQYRNQ